MTYPSLINPTLFFGGAMKDIISALFERVEKLTDRAASLRSDAEDLFKKCAEARAGRLPCVNLFEIESRYWELIKRAERFEQLAERNLEAAALAENGEVPEDLDQLLPNLVEQEKRVSKRRLAMQREQAWMDAHTTDEDLFYDSIYAIFDAVIKTQTPQHGSGRFVQTGRRATRVKGRFDVYDAPDAFFDATADTHGGKVRGGSSAGKGCYVNAKGKQVRKF